MLEKLKLLWILPDLRKKILFTIGLLVIARFAAHVPIPGIDISRLEQFFQTNQFLGLLDLFSGGTISKFSIVMMGVAPYINASIIMQLLTMILPKLEALSKEGEEGRRKINQYTRLLTVPLAAIQAYGMIVVLTRGASPIINRLDLPTIITSVAIATAGTIFLMWLGELITEQGIGNGISLIITIGIIAGIPGAIRNIGATINAAQSISIVILVAVLALEIWGIVVVTEAQRNIPVSYARRVRAGRLTGGVDTHLPIRVNIAGVIPIIFALSVMLFPEMIATFFEQASTHWIAQAALTIKQLFANQLFYGIAYFLLVFVFTFFYTSVVFKPDEISENLQKQGGFVPGLRPGTQTSQFLKFVITRITLFGAIFLGIVAVLPFLLQAWTHIQTLVISGTGVLILVSVVIETMKQVRAQIAMRSYEIS
jgi:preprotein translocase subunit SecY